MNNWKTMKLTQTALCLARVGGKQVGRVVGGFEIVGEGDALAFGLALADGLELFASLGDQLVFVLGNGGSIGVRHEGAIEGQRKIGGKRPLLAASAHFKGTEPARYDGANLRRESANPNLLTGLMFFQIISLLLEVAISVLAGACLLRLYMQFQRIPMSSRSGNPLGRFVFALTDWLVLPLRRVVPALGRWDLASLVGAYLLELMQFLLLWLLAGAQGGLFAVPVLAAFGLLRLAISGMTVLVIVFAVLSWIPTQSVVSDLIGRLCAPPLTPIRRVLPLVGGIDLSPLVLLVLLQIASIVLGHLQGQALLML